MAEALYGVEAYREEYFESQGAPLTGITNWTVQLTNPDGTVGATIASGSITESAVVPGQYGYTADTTQLPSAGFYRELWTGALGSVNARRDQTIFVTANPTLQRWELRHRVARRLGDLWLGTLTATTSTTVSDANNRVEPDGDWGTANLYVYGGTGRQQERALLTSTQSGGALTPGLAWSVTPAVGDRYELHRAFQVGDYNEAINDALDAVREAAPLLVRDESLVETTNTFEYAIPPRFLGLQSVWHRDTTQTTNDWVPLSGRDVDTYQADWRVVPGRILRLPRATTNYAVRLIGWVQAGPLRSDSAYVDVDPTYLEIAAAAILEQARLRGPEQDRAGAAQRLAILLQLQRDHGLTRPSMSNGVRVT